MKVSCFRTFVDWSPEQKLTEIKMDRYTNFSELRLKETEGQDFAIVFRQGDARVAVMAIHGGGIEPGTADIADAVAGDEFTFYAFKGLKKAGNKILHLSSNRYDESKGVQISTDAQVVLSIHGCREMEEIVFVGGRDQQLKQKIISLLRSAGFIAVISEIPGQRGISPQNICNRCRSGKGVQLEISRGIREKMYEEIDWRSLRRKTPVFDAFVRCLKMAMREPT